MAFVEMKQVYKRYRTGEVVTAASNGIDFTIEKGEFAIIVGPSGAGKTTVLNILGGMDTADEGQVLVDGTDVRELPLYHLRESVAMVLQKNTLFSGTIGENLRWGDENATDAQIREAAAIAQADGFVMSFPDGYDTELGQGGVNLSGGQKQRLCIARALLKKPRILILDDSTSAVDTATDASIRRAFREKLPGVTKIIIAQRINSVMDADKIVVLDHGRIVGCGSHHELMEGCQAYREIYWSQKDEQEEEAV